MYQREIISPKDQKEDKGAGEQIRNMEQRLYGEFQSGHLASHFHRKKNEALRLLIGFLVPGSAKNVEEPDSHRNDPSSQGCKTHSSAEKKPGW